ncbi:glucosaminidase domain-containing protein [Patescibacteria group bacterium]|nr:glucosaminidase domain-containing protein [Patescibacteria group bacterium]
MNVEYLIQLLENKLIFLTNSKAQAFMVGDLNTMNANDAEMGEVNETLYKLRLLLSATQVAAGANTDVSTMIAAGMMAVKNAPIIYDGATACMTAYDISTYATDPLHEQKIASILQTMGAMADSSEIDLYIDSKAISSPVTAMMILNAVQEYPVDVRLMMAIMELDSRFGTAGVAVDTMNPGNVGNTGTAIRNYASWQEGVTAVAQWLSRHRITNAQTLETVAAEEVAPVNNTEEVVEPEVATSTEETVVSPTDKLSTDEQPVKTKKTSQKK